MSKPELEKGEKIVMQEVKIVPFPKEEQQRIDIEKMINEWREKCPSFPPPGVPFTPASLYYLAKIKGVKYLNLKIWMQKHYPKKLHKVTLGNRQIHVVDFQAGYDIVDQYKNRPHQKTANGRYLDWLKLLKVEFGYTRSGARKFIVRKIQKGIVLKDFFLTTPPSIATARRLKSIKKSSKAISISP